MVTDVDNANTTVTLTLSDVAAGSLSTATSGSVTSTFIGGVWTATGAIANVNALLASATYNPILNYDQNFSIAINVDDGIAPAVTGTHVMTAIPVNDSPLVATNTGAPVDEGASVMITNTHLNEGDVDDSGAGLAYTVTAGLANGQLELTTNAGVAITAFIQDDIDNNRLIYVHDGSQTSSDNFVFSLADGGENGAIAATGTFNLTVSNVNDTPVNTVPAAQLVDEDTLLAIGGISVNDVDGNLSTVQLTVSNGVLGVTLSGAATVSAGTNGTASLTLSGTQSNINATLASLTYQGNVNFNGADTLTVLSTDDNAATDSDTVSITVTAVNDAPIVNNLHGSSFSAPNDGTLLLLDSDANAFITDPDNATDFNGGTLQLTGNSFDGTDTLGIDTSGSVSLSAGFADGSDISISGVLIGTHSGTSNSGTTVTFNSNATASRIDSLLQSLSFSSTSVTLGARSVDIVFIDGDGVANGGSQTSNTATVNISVASASDGLVTTNEDTDYTFVSTDFDFTGTTGTDLQSITITSLATNGTLTHNAIAVTLNQQITKADIDLGLLKFIPDANDNGSPNASLDFYVNTGNASINVLAGNPSGWTLSSSQLTDTDDILASASNFGVSGTYSASISVVAANSTVDAAYLAQGEVFFDGYVADADWGGAELSALDSWITAGGILISTNDNSSNDAVSASYGLTIGGTADSTWNVAAGAHAIMDGPFGTVGASFQASGVISYFDATSLAGGDLILATDSVSGEPTMVLRQHGSGWILFTSDEGLFRSNMTGGGVISTANDKLAANIFAWAADQTPPSTTYVVNVDVTAVNDDPTNAGSLPTDISVIEDVASNLDLSSIDLSDIDAGASSLTLTFTTSTGGDITAAAGAGITVGGSSTALTLTGSLADLNTYLNTASNLTYLHSTAHINGNDADTIAVKVNDSGNTGTGGGTDIALGSVNVDITAINDGPTVATNTGVTVNEGSTGTVITVAMLNAGDVDDSGAGLTYSVTTDVVNGTLKLSGITIGLNDTFTQADINGGLVTYDHDGTQTSSDSFAFSLADGGENGAIAAIGTFNLTVSNVNDAPTITKEAIFTDTGQSLGGSSSLGIDIGDIDGDGDVDMVVANYSQANKVFLNDGSGNYTDTGQNLGTSNSTAIALGDIDGDGDLDMVVGNNTGFISRVYINDGTGSFTDDGLGLGHGNTVSLELGDLDGDGDLDIVLGNLGEGNKVFTNNGTGTFTDSGISVPIESSNGKRISPETSPLRPHATTPPLFLKIIIRDKKASLCK